MTRLARAAVCAALALMGVMPLRAWAQAQAQEGLAAQALQGRVRAVAEQAGFAGELLVARNGQVQAELAFGKLLAGAEAPHRVGQQWLWASVSKQVAATLAMQAVAAGRLELDAPLTRYRPQSRTPFATRITVRDLLQHTSGLRHSDDGPPNGPSNFYSAPLGSDDTGLIYCEGPGAVPPGPFRYGNCDTIVLQAVLEAIYGRPYFELLEQRVFVPLGMRNSGYDGNTSALVRGTVKGQAEASFALHPFGASGAMWGSLRDLWLFDEALLQGKLLPTAQREAMWQGEPKRGYAALGQWAFPAALKGCKQEFQVIERRGSIQGTQVRNLLVPEKNLVLIAFTNRSDADFNFGEVWQQQGLTHDLLAALLCPE